MTATAPTMEATGIDGSASRSEAPDAATVPNVPRTAADPAVGPADRAIRRFSTLALATVWGIAAAASFTHIRQLAEANGQHGWVAWAIAVSLELVVAMAALEILRDSRTGHPSRAPWLVLLAGAGLVLATNLATAPATPWGWMLAGWPATASMAATKLFVRRLGHAAEDYDRRVATSVTWHGTAATTTPGVDVPAVARSRHVPQPEPGAMPRSSGHASASARQTGKGQQEDKAGAALAAERSALRDHARRRYRDSAARGTPLTGKQLAAHCGMSARWARARIAEERHASCDGERNAPTPQGAAKAAA